MKPNLGGLDLTTRQPATLGEEWGEVFDSVSARTVTFSIEKPGWALY